MGISFFPVPRISVVFALILSYSTLDYICIYRCGSASTTGSARLPCIIWCRATCLQQCNRCPLEMVSGGNYCLRNNRIEITTRIKSSGHDSQRYGPIDLGNILLATLAAIVMAISRLKISMSIARSLSTMPLYNSRKIVQRLFWQKEILDKVLYW
jgi:hypothetical protein